MREANLPAENTPRSKVQELVWASGIFEGEGCISACPRPRLALVMADEDTVERFHQAVGVGRRGGRPPKPPRQRMYCWYAYSFEDVQAVLAMLWSGLGARRRARAREVLGAN